MTVISCRQQRFIYSLLLLSMLGHAHAAEPLEFSLPPYDDAICIPVELAGEEHLFILDSGASIGLIDEKLRDHLGEPLGAVHTTDAVGNRTRIEIFEAPQMQIGKTKWKSSLPVGSFDLSHIRAVTGRNIEGFLGIPFFSTHVIQLDFDRRAVRILPPGTTPESDWGTAVSITIGDGKVMQGAPLIPLELPNVGTELCMLDTGFNGSLDLNWATCYELEKAGSYSPEPDRLSASLSGSQWAREGIVSKVKLQNYEHSGLTAGCAKVGSGVGLRYLKRFRVTLDIGNRVAYFAKGKAFDEPEEIPTGFGAIRDGDKTLIKGVRRAFPGEEAGLRDNDELISVNGQPVDRMSTAEIDWRIRQLSEKGTKSVTLTIRRDDGKTQDRQLDLRLDLSELYE